MKFPKTFQVFEDRLGRSSFFFYPKSFKPLQINFRMYYAEDYSDDLWECQNCRRQDIRAGKPKRKSEDILGPDKNPEGRIMCDILFFEDTGRWPKDRNEARDYCSRNGVTNGHEKNTSEVYNRVIGEKYGEEYESPKMNANLFKEILKKNRLNFEN